MISFPMIMMLLLPLSRCQSKNRYPNVYANMGRVELPTTLGGRVPHFNRQILTGNGRFYVKEFHG